MTDLMTQMLDDQSELIESLRQQLAECRKEDISLSAPLHLEQQLVECQAREKVLRDAAENLRNVKGRFHSEKAYERLLEVLAILSDSTALDTMLKQAKREALLEAAEYVGRNLHDNKTYSDELIRMAKELE